MGEPRKIYLTQGFVTLVDERDYHVLVTSYLWHALRRADGKVCAVTGGGSRSSKPRVYLHRLLLQPTDSEEVDHIDGDTLNNQRGNIRLCTRSQNMMNTSKRGGTTSTYKGVSWRRQDKCWSARLTLRGRVYWLGRYQLEEDAAKAYNKAAIIHFGEFARLNEVNEERG